MPDLKDKLYLLISKLSASERGYVNKHLKVSKSKSNLLKVFALICKFKPKEDAEVRKKIKDPYLLRNFAVTKKQLFDRIVKILRDYHANKGELRAVLSMIEDIDFLFNKEMHDECMKILRKAIKICNNYEFYTLKLHLLEWRKRIINVQYDRKNYEKEILVLEEVSSATIDKFLLIHKMELTKLTLHNNVFHNVWSNDKGKLQAEMQDISTYVKKISNLSDSESLRFKIVLANLSSTVFYFSKRPDKAYEVICEKFEDLKPAINPLIAEDYQKKMIIKLGLSIRNKDKRRSDEAVAQINAVHKKYPPLKSHRDNATRLLVYELLYGLAFGKAYDEEKARAVDLFLDENAEKIVHGAWMCFSLARYYFGYGRFHLAHSLNIKTLSQPKRVAKHFEYASKFLSVMISLELQRFNLVDRELQELRRYLKTLGDVRPHDLAIIKFLRKAKANWGRSMKTTLFEQFNELASPYKQEIRINLYHLDLSVWMEAYEKKVTMAEINKSRIAWK